jgi:MtN3 and saliva related transmembrane protein
MINILAVGAVVGGIIGIIAYIPQGLHLIKVKDSAGISLFAWFSWLLGNLLLLIYAISIKNVPYIIDYSLFCIANMTIIILTFKYKK